LPAIATIFAPVFSSTVHLTRRASGAASSKSVTFVKRPLEARTSMIDFSVVD